MHIRQLWLEDSKGLGECEPTTPLSGTFKNWDSHHLLSSRLVSIYFKQLKVKFLSNMFLTNPCRLNVPILGLSKLFVSFSGKKNRENARKNGRKVVEWKGLSKRKMHTAPTHQLPVSSTCVALCMVWKNQVKCQVNVRSRVAICCNEWNCLQFLGFRYVCCC